MVENKVIINKMNNYKINISNCPGDFEESVDWEYYSNTDPSSYEGTIYVQEHPLLDFNQFEYKERSSVSFQVLDLNK